jgi:hypothetical protein
VRYVCHQTDSRIRISKLSLSVFCLSRPAAPASGRGKSGAKKPRFGGAKSFHEPTPQTKRQTGVCTPVPRCADRDRVSLCRADAVPPHASLIAAYPAAAQGAHTARPRHETFASSSPKKRPSPWGPRNTTAELTDRCGCMHGCSRTHRHTGTQAHRHTGTNGNVPAQATMAPGIDFDPCTPPPMQCCCPMAEPAAPVCPLT